VKRASAGGLVLGMVVLTGLGVAGSMIPYKTCRTCEGPIGYIMKGPFPPDHPPRVFCPDCSDRRKITLFRYWIGSRVAPTTASLLLGLKEDYQHTAHEGFESMARQRGPDGTAFLKAAIPAWHYLDGAAFLEAEHKTYVALFAYLGPGIFPPYDGTTVILLSADGRALDFVQVCWMGYLTASVEDGAQVVVHNIEPIPLNIIGTYRLVQWKCEPREGKANTTTEVLRFRVRDDRLEVVGHK
jgi:hypothetical protein